jgi:hypothetical protein
MKKLFFAGGPTFMGILSILLVITTAWIIYHLISSYNSKQTNQEKLLHKIEYGKSMGLFAMVTGILGQLIGLYSMFSVLAEITNVEPIKVFGAIKATMLSSIYGILIYLFSIMLCFIASLIIEKKTNN